MINGKSLILAVDDEEPIRNLIKYTFEPYELEVVTAENGKSAITILEHNPVDVIITDLLMPSMTGLALIREMKKRKSQIPIIIITAYGNTEMVKEIIDEEEENKKCYVYFITIRNSIIKIVQTCKDLIQ